MQQARQAIQPQTQNFMRLINSAAQQMNRPATANEVTAYNQYMQNLHNPPKGAVANAMMNIMPVGATENVASKALSNPYLRDALGQFATKGIQSAAKVLGEVHPMDINEVAPALERLLSTPATNADYHIQDAPDDLKLISTVAEHYVPGVMKDLGHDPVAVAKALMARIMAGRK